MPYLRTRIGQFSVSSCSSPFCLSLSSQHLLSTCCFQLLLEATKAVTSPSEVVRVLGNPWSGRAGLCRWSQLLEEVLDRESKVVQTPETLGRKGPLPWRSMGTGGLVQSPVQSQYRLRYGLCARGEETEDVTLPRGTQLPPVQKNTWLRT